MWGRRSPAEKRAKSRFCESRNENRLKNLAKSCCCEARKNIHTACSRTAISISNLDGGMIKWSRLHKKPLLLCMCVQMNTLDTGFSVARRAKWRFCELRNENPWKKLAKRRFCESSFWNENASWENIAKQSCFQERDAACAVPELVLGYETQYIKYRQWGHVATYHDWYDTI